MKAIKTKFIALFAVALAGLVSTANAQVVSIQLQESGFATEFIGSGTSTANFSGNFGTFFISRLVGTASNQPVGLLLGGGQLSTTAGGTLTVLITATGVTSDISTNVPFHSTFAEDFGLQGSVTDHQSSFVDPADVAFSMAHPLNSATLSAPGSVDQDTVLGSLPSPYSLTLEFVITANGAANSFPVARVTAAPEPSTWAMMLIGFAGLGFAFRQSRRRASFG